MTLGPEAEQMSTKAEPATHRLPPTDELAGYRKDYPARDMRRDPNNQDELILMPHSEGLYELSVPPVSITDFPRHSSLPTTEQTAPEARHLWVIRPDGVPVALEACQWGKDLESGCIKHSNLTGGGQAHSGGEIWFIGEDRIAINAASGRYGAESAAEFKIITDAVRRSGYHVASMGFDLDNISIPNTVFIGEPEWETPL